MEKQNIQKDESAENTSLEKKIPVRMGDHVLYLSPKTAKGVKGLLSWTRRVLKETLEKR